MNVISSAVGIRKPLVAGSDLAALFTWTRATSGLFGMHWTVVFILNFGFVTLEASAYQAIPSDRTALRTLLTFVVTEACTYTSQLEVFGIGRKNPEACFR